MNDYERMMQRAIAAEASLRFLAFHFDCLDDLDRLDGTEDDEESGVIRCIHAYSINGADSIRELINALRKRDGRRKEESTANAIPSQVHCNFGEGVTMRPDGKHELSPHAYTLTQRLRNVTVEILTCKTCGDVSVAWYRQADTEDVTEI